MEEITLTEKLEVGKATITKYGRTYTEYDFVGNIGTIIRKHENGFFESVSPPDTYGFITTMPIGKMVSVIDLHTEQESFRFDKTIGEKVWEKSQQQTKK